MEQGQGLTVWVVYSHPSDYPDHIVVRPQVVGPGQVTAGQPALYGDLDEARAELSGAGLYRMDRQPDDDPVIVEVWL